MFLEKNLNALKDKNSELVDMIKNSIEDNSVEVFPVKTGGITVKLNGKLLHSLYNPVGEAQKNLEKIEFKDKKVVMHFGFGCGYIAQESLRLADEKTKIMIFEENLSLLKAIFSNWDFSDFLINDSVFLYHTSQKYKFAYKLEENFKIGIVPEYEIIFHKAEYQFYEKEYNECADVLKDVISNTLVSTSTIFEFSKMWHMNSFKNIKYFANSIGTKEFEGKFKDIPAIVVAAGPSLDKNIKYLHWCKGKAIIIAVGTSLKKLMDEGITPDFVMAIDGGEPNWEHFRRVEYAEIPLIYEPMVTPKITSFHTGPKIVFVSQNIVGSWGEYLFGEKGFIKMGGSVAISAYDFAVKMGANPVVLLGQDLAYSGGKTHVSGSLYEKDTVTKNNTDIHQMFVDDVYGGKVLSDRKFYTFIQYFERFIDADLKEKKKNNEKFEVFDCTEGGAKLEGSIVKSLKDVYFNYIENSEVDMASFINEWHIKLSNEYEKNIEKLNKEKDSMAKKLKKVKKSAEAGAEIINRFLKYNDYSKINKLNKIDEEINSEIEVGNLLKYITQPILSEILKKTKEGISETELFKINIKLYNGIIEGINYNLECMKEM